MTVKSKPGHFLNEQQMRAVAELFGVLSEPTRLRILQRLQAGRASVGQLVDELGIKQANASKQLGILLQAGVLDREQVGNSAFYSIRMPLVFELCNLVCNRLREDARQQLKSLAR